MRNRALAALLVASAMARGAGAGAAEPTTTRVEVHARALVPGEPVRVVVESTALLTSVEGTFIDRRLDFIRDVRGRWLAWGVIPLGRAAGPAKVRVSARTADGAPARASRTIEILPKRFPTQKLDVESKFVTPPPEVEARIAAERKRLAAIYAKTSAGPPAAHSFLAPVQGPPTSTFGARRIFNGVPRDPHPGLDLRAATGSPVAASGGGRVALAAELYFSGGTVIVDHGGGLFTVYAHLSRIDVHADDEVETGTKVGLSGATGRVTGPHLHWGAKIGETPFDPRALLDSKLFR